MIKVSRAARWAWAVGMAVAPLCAAQVAAKKNRAPDPCQARVRCLRLYRLGKAASVAALEKAFHAGCDGYSEEAIRALRLYQLGAPGSAQALLNSMPRGIGDFVSFLWMATDGTFETAGDINSSYGTVYPMDELVSGGCRDGAPRGGAELFRFYFRDLAKLSAAHAKYLPGFLITSQLFGYRAEWDEFDAGTEMNVDGMFSRLLGPMLGARPKEFRQAAIKSGALGWPALKQAKAALAAEKRAKEHPPDPCQARVRCLRLYRLGKAASVAALEKAFHAGCDGYSEEAIRALRLYQLGAPGGAQALLNSMPRGIGDVMSLLWMTDDGSADDQDVFYGVGYPKDQLPENGCRDGAAIGAAGEFRSYFADLASLSESHPKYMPRFFAVSQLFGYEAQWEVYKGTGSVDVGAMFSRLLASILEARPKEFMKTYNSTIDWGNLAGTAALEQARAALAAEKHKTPPEKPK